jgi:CysZ protein
MRIHIGGVPASIGFAFLNLLHPRILWLMVWPVLIAAVIWGVVVTIFWTQAVLWVAAHLSQWLAAPAAFFSVDPAGMASFLAKVAVVLMVVPLVQLTALLILGVFGMPQMVSHVAAQRFPQLARRQGGGEARVLAGSLWNSLVALAGMLVLGVVTLPLWIIPPLWPLIPPLVLGWVNQRVLRYDALAEHATAEEMKAVFKEKSGMLYLLGFVLALLAYIPVLGWFAPVLFGLAMIHFLLEALQRLRAQPIEGQVLEVS